MTTVGEFTWAGILSNAGKLLPEPLSYNDDTVVFEFRLPSGGWQLLRSGNVFSFRFVDFAIRSEIKRAPKLRLVFARNRLGQQPIYTYVRVIWSRVRITPSGDMWLYSYKYHPDLLVFKVMPAGRSIEKGAKIVPFEARMSSLRGRPIPTIYQVADQLSGPRGRVKRSRRNSFVRKTKSTARSNPENDSHLVAHYRETQAAPYQQFGNDTVVHYSRSHSGLNRTPGFGSVRKSNMPVNAHNVSLLLTEDDRCVDFRHNDANTTWFNVTRATSQNFTIPAPFSFGVNPNTRNKAIKSLQEKSSQGVSNLAVDFAQFGQFNRLVGNTAYRLVHSVRALRRGRLDNALEALVAGRPTTALYGGRPSKSKTLASNWLELQYAWKPLIQDVVEARQALRQYALKSNLVSVVRSSASDVQKKTGVLWSNVAPPADSPPNDKIGRYGTSYFTQYRFSVRFQASNHLKTFLQQTGFNNPINFFWEILPFSFVADWFLPVGPYLECLSANQGLTFLDGSETLFIRREHLASFSFSGRLGGLTAANNRNASLRGRYSQTWIYHDRKKLSSFPAVTFPTFKNPLSITHALNGLALLRSVFR